MVSVKQGPVTIRISNDHHLKKVGAFLQMPCNIKFRLTNYKRVASNLLIKKNNNKFLILSLSHFRHRFKEEGNVAEFLEKNEFPYKPVRMPN